MKPPKKVSDKLKGKEKSPPGGRAKERLKQFKKARGEDEESAADSDAKSQAENEDTEQHDEGENRCDEGST